MSPHQRHSADGHYIPPRRDLAPACEHPVTPLDGRQLLDELLREKNVQPIRSVDDLACDGIFETDEELGEFLVWVAVERHANLA